MRFLSLMIGGLMATAATAQDITGTFDLSQAACKQTASDGRVTVTGNTIQFWESQCRLSNPTTLRGITSAKLYDVTCSGEGDTWTYRILLGTQYDGGLVLYREGGGTVYVRC